MNPKYHNSHVSWLWNHNNEKIVLFGVATGRVDYDARWLYSFRVFIGILKVELLWTTQKK